jgi:hypothetical protein
MGINLRLGDVWAQALDAADFTNTQFPDVNRKADIVNRGIKRLHYLCANSSQNFICSTYPFLIQNAVQYYPLPNDFYRLLKIYFVDNGMYRVMRRATFEMVHGFENTITNITTPTCEMNYVPVAPKFSNPPNDDQIIATNFPDGFEDAIIQYVRVAILGKAEKPTTDARQDLGDALGEAREYLEPRDAAEPAEMVDVHQRWRRPWPFALVRPAIADVRYMLFGNQLRLFQTDSREI